MITIMRDRIKKRAAAAGESGEDDDVRDRWKLILGTTVNGPPLSVGPAQERERNRSSDCSGTYPNCRQLPPTDPSCAEGSLFLQASRCVDNPGEEVAPSRQVKGSQSLLRTAAIKLW
jgi:hypothetical protein